MLNDLSLQDIKKIIFSFYDNKDKKSSANFTLRVPEFLDENSLNEELEN